MEKLSFLNLKEKINEILLNIDTIDEALKNDFSKLFSISAFENDDFLKFIDKASKSMIKKNIKVQQHTSENIQNINKSFEIALSKNQNEIEDFNKKTETTINNLLKELETYKREQSDKIFGLRIKNETAKSEHYVVYEEEISQIQAEIKERKDSFLIEQNKLEHEKNAKLEKLNHQYKTKIDILENEIKALEKPFDEEITNLKLAFEEEQKNKDESYLTIKKTHQQSSIKFNDFIKELKSKYNEYLEKIKTDNTNKINDYYLDIEDLEEYLDKAIEFIQNNHAEKIKALDIIFDVQRNDHNKQLAAIIETNNNEISNINANFRQTRENLNETLNKNEQEKLKKIAKAKDETEKQNITKHYRKLNDKLKRQILKLNEENEINLMKQDIVFQTKIYNQDLKHLKHVNEWRHTKELYEKDKELKIAIEKEKYEHELYILKEKIKLEKELYKRIKKIEEAKLEIKLLPIESQLFFTSQIQTRDIDLLNLEFDSYKRDNELKIELAKLNNNLEKLNLNHEINLLKSRFSFDKKIIEIESQLEIEKSIIKRDSDLKVLEIESDLQQTLLDQKNKRQDNLLAGRVNQINLEIEKYQITIENKIKKLRQESLFETNKRNYIINSIKNKNQMNINALKSDKNIALAKHEAELNYEINKYVTTYILSLYQSKNNMFETFTKAVKAVIPPNTIRKMYQIIGDYNKLILNCSINALDEYLKYCSNAFEQLKNDFFEPKLKTKHADIINFYNDNASVYQNKIDSLVLKINEIESENKDLLAKIEKNLIFINSTLLANKNNLTENEEKQINLLKAENKTNLVFINNNKKLIKRYKSDIKRNNKALSKLSKKQKRNENKLFKNDMNERNKYSKLFYMQESKFANFVKYLNNDYNKYQIIFKQLNQDSYLDNTKIDNLVTLANKQMNKHYEFIIKKQFKILDFFKKIYTLTKKNETEIINRFNKSAVLADKENNLYFEKAKKTANNDNIFNNKIFNKELERINKELKIINEDTSLNVKQTHDQYKKYYIKAESDVKNLKILTSKKIQLINENLAGAIATINNNSDKSRQSIIKENNKNKTKILTNIILTKNNIKDNTQKNDVRANVLLTKYNKIRSNHLEQLKNKRKKYHKIIDGLEYDINILNQAYEIKIKRNLKETKANINSLKASYNDVKVNLKKTFKKELKANSKKHQVAYKFKHKQIKRKRK